MRKCLHLVFWLAILGITLSTEAFEVKPARYRSSLKLHCNCPSTIAEEDIHSRQWIEYRNHEVQIVQNARDNWGPRLYNKNESLLLQNIDSKYLKENISYVCNSTLFNGSSVLCAGYSVKGYECKTKMPETTKPQNLTNLEIGNSASFSCTHYFTCEQFGGSLSVTMNTVIKNSRVSCNISYFGLQQSCQLSISALGAEDFGKPVKCIVMNDRGEIYTYEAFPFQKKVKVIEVNKSENMKYIIISISVVGVLLVILAYFICCKRNLRYRLMNKYKCLNFFEDKKSCEVLVHEVDEEELLSSSPFLPLDNFLKGYHLSDVTYGHNIIEDKSKLANETAVALIIMVDVHRLTTEQEYKNRVNNVLKSDAAKGKTKIWPYYTTVLYIHKDDCDKYGDSCSIRDRGQIFSLELKGPQDIKCTIEKLRKRLPPEVGGLGAVSSSGKSNYSSMMDCDGPVFGTAAGNLTSEISTPSYVISDYAKEGSCNAAVYATEASNASCYESVTGYTSISDCMQCNSHGHVISHVTCTCHSTRWEYSNGQRDDSRPGSCYSSSGESSSHPDNSYCDYSRMNSNVSCCSETPLI